MSRIGKIPIAVPTGVDVRIEGRTVRAKGPQGQLEESLPEPVRAKLEDGKLVLTAEHSDSSAVRALYGTARARVANMVHGVHAGFTRVLEIVGLGYKAQLAGNKLTLSLGRSHPVEFTIPEDVKVTVDPKATQITLASASRQKVGAVAAAIRSLRPPEPYKGTGIRYQGEHILRKAGKTAAGVGAGSGGAAAKK